MPELPDVEGFRRLLAATAARRRITAVHAPGREVLRNTTPQALGRALAGRRLGVPWRRGKWLFTPVLREAGGREAVLLTHFGMDGSLAWVGRARAGPAGDAGPDVAAGRPEGGETRPRDVHDRFILCLDGGELRYHSIRKLGGVWLVEGVAGAAAVTGPLGPDALDLDAAGLARRLAGRRAGIKSALMNQAVVAGLGNLTVDEILWRAHLWPKARSSDLEPAELGRLHGAMRAVLAASVPAGRVPDREGWLTRVRARQAPTCPRCGEGLARGRIVGRATLWCPRCQPQKKVRTPPVTR